MKSKKALNLQINVIATTFNDIVQLTPFKSSTWVQCKYFFQFPRSWASYLIVSELVLGSCISIFSCCLTQIPYADIEQYIALECFYENTIPKKYREKLFFQHCRKEMRKRL